MLFGWQGFIGNCVDIEK